MDVQDKVPYALLKTIVVHAEDSDDLGALVAEKFVIKHVSGVKKADDNYGKKGDKWEITEAEIFANLCSALQSLGIDTADMELEDLAEAQETIESDQEACRVEIGIKKNGYKFIKWGKPIDDDDLPGIEDVLDDDEDEETDDDEEALSLIHIPSPRDQRGSRMPSSA